MRKKRDGILIVGWSQAPTMLGKSNADCWALAMTCKHEIETSEDYIKAGCDLCAEDELCELHAYRQELAHDGFVEQKYTEKKDGTMIYKEIVKDVALIAIEFDEYNKLVDVIVDNVKEANKLLKKHGHDERLKYLPTFNALEIEDEQGRQHLTYAVETIKKRAFE